MSLHTDIQELQATINALKEEIKVLSNRVSELESPTLSDNAHEGFDITAFESPWSHKGEHIIRYMPPEPFSQVTKEIQYAIATDGNIDRPITMHVVPVLVNARKPKELKSYRWLEDWRMERQPQGPNERLRYNWVFNGADVRQWRIFLPPKFDTNGNQIADSTYTILLDWDLNRDEFRFFHTLGQWNKLNIAKTIEIHGGGKLKLGEMCWYYPASSSSDKKPFISFGAGLITEKDGKKFVRVKQAGVTYGIPLEVLD